MPKLSDSVMVPTIITSCGQLLSAVGKVRHYVGDLGKAEYAPLRRRDAEKPIRSRLAGSWLQCPLRLWLPQVVGLIHCHRHWPGFYEISQPPGRAVDIRDSPFTSAMCI